MVRNRQTENVWEHQVTGSRNERTVPHYPTERPSDVQQQRHGAECEQGQYSQQGRGDKGYQHPHDPEPGNARSGLPHPSGGKSSEQRFVVKESSAIPGTSVAGTSTPPAPDLHQASVEKQSVDSSLAKHFQQVTVEGGTTSEAIRPVVPAIPHSSKSLRFPLRPGKGSIGIQCVVKANHFLAKLSDKDIRHYDVSIMPEDTPRAVNRAVIHQLVSLYLGGRLPVYDGRKSLYTAEPLPFNSKEFKIILSNEDDNSGKQRSFSEVYLFVCSKSKSFQVKIKLAAKVNLYHLTMFLSGQQADAPHEALQALDIVLRELPTTRYSPIGRSFYSPSLGMRKQLREGLESWQGFYQSIRPTQMGLSLNIDLSSTAFIQPLPVVGFVAQLLKKDIRQRLHDADREKIEKALRGVRIEVTHRGNMRRKYRIFDLTSQPTSKLTFLVDERGNSKSVVQYFRETYGLTLEYTHLPCLQVSNKQKPNYLPMEVCEIVEGQRYSNRLNQDQITALLHGTWQDPFQLEKNILQTVQHNAYESDQYAKEFGIKISNKLALVEARILPAPRLKYHETGREKDCLPKVGQWNMINKKMVNGGKVNCWTCINFALNVTEEIVREFCYRLASMCQISGMEFSLAPILPLLSVEPDQMEGSLRDLYVRAMNILRPQAKQLDLLVVILPNNNGSLYGDLKRICETELGVISQCCLSKNVSEMQRHYLANVSLKINVKVGGRNTVLMDAAEKLIPIVCDEPTIIFGADVTHPHPGEDSRPSIAAVVASQDWPEITKYAGLVSAQAHRQELIMDLFKEQSDPQTGTVAGGMIRELLISFIKANNARPKRIIFYRDGVSEGQFYQVLLHELGAIRKACASLDRSFQPQVTFIVVQKRHHTRLFAKDDENKTVNILPGTVVDSKICHPTEFDFYLCSHAAIQGTSRPAHYHVLWDENNFTADQLQSLTNNLCYTYARCTRSVSIVPPVYYAHLAAFRARFYMQPQTYDNASHSSTPTGVAGQGTQRTSRGDDASVIPLPAIKDNVKKGMFFC